MWYAINRTLNEVQNRFFSHTSNQVANENETENMNKM